MIIIFLPFFFFFFYSFFFFFFNDYYALHWSVYSCPHFSSAFFRARQVRCRGPSRLARPCSTRCFIAGRPPTCSFLPTASSCFWGLAPSAAWALEPAAPVLLSDLTQERFNERLAFVLGSPRVRELCGEIREAIRASDLTAELFRAMDERIAQERNDSGVTLDWKADAESTQCHACGFEFRVWSTVLHCYSCGQVFCTGCLTEKRRVPCFSSCSSFCLFRLSFQKKFPFNLILIYIKNKTNINLFSIY
jgi:hypothetical protein